MRVCITSIVPPPTPVPTYQSSNPSPSPGFPPGPVPGGALAYAQSIACKYGTDIYDKFRHCVVSCEVAKKYDPGTAYVIGLGHEVLGGTIITQYKPTMEDIAANMQGINFAQNFPAQSCHKLCKDKYGLEYPQH